jgi:hypothetical protein
MRKDAHPDPTTLEWIRSHCEPIPFAGCWIWTRAVDRDGYAAVSVKAGGVYRRTEGHLAAYTIQHGRVPAGMMLDHLCRNRACCNPDHLEPVTAKENHARSPTTAPERAAVWRNARTHCPRCGHEWALRQWKRGTVRVCPSCRNANARRRYSSAPLRPSITGMEV